MSTTSSQRVWRKRFLQQEHIGLEHAVVRQHVIRVARNVEYLQSGPHGLEAHGPKTLLDRARVARTNVFSQMPIAASKSNSCACSSLAEQTTTRCLQPPG